MGVTYSCALASGNFHPTKPVEISTKAYRNKSDESSRAWKVSSPALKRECERAPKIKTKRHQEAFLTKLEAIGWEAWTRTRIIRSRV